MEFLNDNSAKSWITLIAEIKERRVSKIDVDKMGAILVKEVIGINHHLI